MNDDEIREELYMLLKEIHACKKEWITLETFIFSKIHQAQAERTREILNYLPDSWNHISPDMSLKDIKSSIEERYKV